MSNEPMTTGDEPSLGGGQYDHLTGQEPVLTGEAAILHLLNLLTHPEPEVRLRAAIELSSLGDQRALDILCDTLQDDNPATRRRAVTALGHIDDRRAIDALFATLHSDGSLDVIKEAALSLGRIGNLATIPALDNAFETAPRVSEAIGQALHLIGQKNPEAIQPVIDGYAERLRSDNDSTKRQAVFRLWYINLPAAVSALTEALNDPAADERFQYMVIEVLKRMQAKQASPALEQMLITTSGSIRLRVVSALKILRERTALPRLIALLDHPDWKVRRYTAHILGIRKARTAIPRLIELLDDGRALVRAEAAIALGRLDVVEAVDRIMALLDDRVEKVRLAAIYAMGRIGRPDRVIDTLADLLGHEDDPVKLEAVRAFRQIGDARVVDRLIPLLKSDDRRIRYNTLKTLGKIGDRRAVPALLDELGTPDDWPNPYPTYPSILTTITETLGLIGSPEAIPALKRFIDHPVDRICNYAIHALVLMENPEAKAALREIAEGDNPAARAIAARHLERIERLQAESTHDES